MNKHEAKMHFVNCVALAAVLFTTLTANICQNSVVFSS